MTMEHVDEDVWVGIDLGTQSVRALAVRTDGTVVGTGTNPLESSRNGARHEQNPQAWWAAVCASLRQALSEVRREAISGVAVAATSGTVLMLDEHGQPLTPGLMYDDRRATSEVDEVNEAGAEMWESLGYQRMQAAWGLPKLIWLLRQHPEMAANARLAHQNDFINRQLIGHDVPTDLSNALKTGVDLVAEAWPIDIMRKLNIPERVLPTVVRSGTVLGTVSSIASNITGLPIGTIVVSGSTDGCAAQIGAGVLSVGSWNSVLGTTLVLKGVSKNLINDPRGVVYSHKASNQNWLPGGASSTGAGIISRDFAGRNLGQLEAAARQHEPAGPLVYPLVGEGERFPFVAPEARGFTLHPSDDDGETYAAVLQGVGFVERLAFDYLHSLGADLDGPLVLTGGATKSAYWNQLRADILQREVTIPVTAEPALGMAVLAASVAANIEQNAARMVRVREVIEPRATSVHRFDTKYLQFVSELEHRGWLDAGTAAYSRNRTAA